MKSVEILSAIENIHSWLKGEFPSSIGGKKIFNLGKDATLPNGETFRHVAVLELSAFDEGAVAKSTMFIFARELTLDQRCSQEYTLLWKDGGELMQLVEGIRGPKVHGKETTNFTTYHTDESLTDWWKFDGAFSDFAEAIQDLVGLSGEPITPSHPLLRKTLPTTIKIQEL